MRAGGKGHGPYWYAYWKEDGRLFKQYIGRRTPTGSPSPKEAPPPPPPPASSRSRPLDDYETIGIPSSSSWQEIRRGFKRAVFAAHPDRGGKVEELKRINLAYERLRKRHDSAHQ